MASRWCGFGAFRCYLLLLNTFYIAISIFLIALVVVARTFAYQISSLYVVIGVAVVASILFILAIIGIVAAVRHHQVVLFFYMILMGISGVTLFAVSVATLALDLEDAQINVFSNAWNGLSAHDKTEIQNSLNCCGFSDHFGERIVVFNESDSGCRSGHPFCNTTTLIGVRLDRDLVHGYLHKCCQNYNPSALFPPSHNTSSTYPNCWSEEMCPDCHSCYTQWESTVTAGVKAAGAFGLIFSFTQIVGILISFRYRNLKDPYANPREILS